MQPFCYADGSEEFYGHREDPNEWHNLARQEELAGVTPLHRQQSPTEGADVLPGNSTRHQACEAASSFVNP